MTLDNRAFRKFCFGPDALGIAIPLTEREQEVYEYLSKGYSSEAMRNRTGLTVKHVEDIIKSIRYKGWL